MLIMHVDMTSQKMTVKSVKDGEKLSGEIKLARSMFGAAVDINISSSSQVRTGQ